MARKYLFNKDYKFYKGNFHCHSTCSDGVATPEQIKEAYMQKGYSVVAYSDHNVMIPHTELIDENFVAITAGEYNFSDQYSRWPNDGQYHLNFFAKNKDQEGFIPFEMEYSTKNVSKIFDDAHKAGFLCELCHPRWSYNAPRDFVDIENMDAFEIMNGGSERATCDGECEYEYDLFMRYGNKPVTVLGGDDNHGYDDRFWGWTWLSLPELTYDSVINAVEKGECYASWGPEIKEAYVEDNKLYIKTSPCKKIGVLTNTRACATAYASDGENLLTEAVLDLNFDFKYMRVCVVDNANNRAVTKAYLKEEL